MSYTATILRCGSLAIMRPSSRKRRSACSTSADAESPLRRMTLIATLRSSERCSARYTVDMPPAPNWRRISYPGIWMKPLAIGARPRGGIITSAGVADSGARQGQAHGQPAALAVGDGDASAVRLGDFARQRQAETGAAALGRIERQQRVGQYGFAHAAAAVAHLDAHLGAALDHLQFERRGRTAGLVRVLEQIDQRLLDLGAIESTGRRRRCRQHERLLPRQLREELVPRHLFRSRLRQPREARVAADEGVEMARAFGDGVEHRQQARGVALPG